MVCVFRKEWPGREKLCTVRASGKKSWGWQTYEKDAGIHRHARRDYSFLETQIRENENMKTCPRCGSHKIITLASRDNYCEDCSKCFPAVKEVRGTWPANDIRRAFVAGAKWWEFHSTGGTMWQSDRGLAEAEATKRYGEKP